MKFSALCLHSVVAAVFLLNIAGTADATVVFTLDFANGGNADPGSGNLGSTTTTVTGVALGGGVTVDVTIMSTGGNIHAGNGSGLGVSGAASNQMNGSETLTVSLSNFVGTTSEDHFTFTELALTGGNGAGAETNLNADELLAVAPSGESSFTVAGSNASLAHLLSPTPSIASGESYTFSFTSGDSDDSLRISRLSGELLSVEGDPELVPEPSSCVLTICGIMAVWVIARRRRK